MSNRRRLTPGRAAAIGLASAGLAWELQRRADRRRVLADPAHAALRAPLEGRPVRVRSADGTEIHAEEFGPEGAPTVVLVHGWTCALRFWTHQIRALSRDLRVVAYDLRGHGRSRTDPGAAFSTDAFAADLDAVLEACVPEGERAVVAGHSLGAITLVAWAATNAERVTERVSGAALINTGMGDLISESLVLRAPGPLDRARRALGRTLLAARAPIPRGTTPLSHRAIRYIALSPSASPATVAFCEHLVLECRRDVRAACGDTLSRLELHDGVASLRVPTVVIAGERDRLTPPSHSRRLAGELPELIEHVEIPTSGHMTPLEHPDEVSSRLRRLALASTGVTAPPTPPAPPSNPVAG